MPRKIRQLKAEMRQSGFRQKSGKGSHTKWEHPLLPDVLVSISGNDGDDARPYQEKEVAVALRKLQEVKGQ